MVENNKMPFHDLDTWKDIIEGEPPLYDDVLEKYRDGQVSIGVHRSSARFIYFTLSSNPLVKLFHSIITIYSFPLTAIVAIVIFIVIHRYLYILYYLVGFFIFLAVEDYLLEAVS